MLHGYVFYYEDVSQNLVRTVQKFNTRYLIKYLTYSLIEMSDGTITMVGYIQSPVLHLKRLLRERETHNPIMIRNQTGSAHEARKYARDFIGGFESFEFGKYSDTLDYTEFGDRLFAAEPVPYD